MHAVNRCGRGCTYRRGLGVACSEDRAIPEPQLAEQQQCSPAFFMQMPCVCIEAEHSLAGDRFFYANAMRLY